MHNKIRYLLFYSIFCISLCSCGKEDPVIFENSVFFENLTVSENGLLDWNDISDANFYLLSCDGIENEIWTDKSEINLNQFFSENSVKKIKIEAYSQRTALGKIMIPAIEDNIFYCNGKFYKYDEAPRFKVTIKIKIGDSVTRKIDYDSVLFTDIDLYRTDILDNIATYSQYSFDGLYLDSEHKTKVDENFYLANDLTLYANTIKTKKNVTFYYAYGDDYDETKNFLSLTLNMKDKFNLNEIDLSKIEGTFSYWKGFEEYKDGEIPLIDVSLANSSYVAIFYRDVIFTFLDGVQTITQDMVENGFFEVKKITSHTLNYKGELTKDFVDNCLGEKYSKYYISKELPYWFAFAYDYESFATNYGTKFIEIKEFPFEYCFTSKERNEFYIWGE